MKLHRRRHAVREAEAALEARHAALRAHWTGFKHAGGDVATPGRIVLAGLLLGYLSGRTMPALAQPEFKADLDRGLDLLLHLLRLASAALPMLAPLWATKTADGSAAAPMTGNAEAP